MSTPFYKGREGLANSIQRYGFAATIEVTNALEESVLKSDQAKLARSYLELISGGDAKIMAGIAYNGDWVDPKSMCGLDFLIDINCYNPGRLESVAREMRNSDYLTPKDKFLLDAILQNYCPEMPLATFFVQSLIKPCSGYLGINTEEYRKRLSDLKGLCMELYIRSVFDDQIHDKIILHRQEFNYKVGSYGKSAKIRHSDADNIVICRKPEFYEALRKIQADDEFITWLNLNSIDTAVL
jgi:hypothetical protein